MERGAYLKNRVSDNTISFRESSDVAAQARNGTDDLMPWNELQESRLGRPIRCSGKLCPADTYGIACYVCLPSMQVVIGTAEA